MFALGQGLDWYTGFSQTPIMGKIGIVANFVFPYIKSFLLYFHIIMVVNVKLDVSEG